MLRLCCLALCLALVSSLAIGNKRKIGNAFQDKLQHLAARHRDRVILNRRLPVGPSNNNPILSDCKTKNTNEMCKQASLRGGTFLTNLEGTALGPGFPPKPVGLLVRQNVSREEESSTSAPEGRFLEDDKPPMPPPPLKRRPLPKGSLRRPILNFAERQVLSKEDIDPLILGPLFFEDTQNTESLKKAGEKSQGIFLRNSNGSGERNRALLDSFNELDQPDPRLLSELKGKLYQNPKLLSELKVKLYPNYFGENKNSVQNGKEGLRRSDRENADGNKINKNSEEANHFRKEDRNSVKSVEEEGPVSSEEALPEETSEDYENSKEEGAQDNSEEEHRSSHSAEELSQEGEEPVLVFDSDNQENSEEDENQSKAYSREEEKPEDSEEEGNQSPNPPSAEGLESPLLIKQGPKGPLENNGQKLSSLREEGGPESEESAEGEGQIPKSGEGGHSAEESTEDRDYSEENNNIDSSAPSEEDTYHSSVEEETSNESNESAQKPASSSEDTNEIRQTSIESSSEENEDYDSRELSREQHSEEQESEERNSQEQQSEENPDKSSSEYDEEKPPDYYYIPDYDNASPESDYEDILPKPEQEPTKKPRVYYKKRPATFYYIVGGHERGEKEPNNESDNADNGSKQSDYEDNKIKQSEEVDSSTPSAEEHPSFSSDESFGSMGFEGFDLDSVLRKPMVESDDKTTKSPVAVISNTTPQTASTKCDDNDTKMNEDSEDHKRLKTPSGTAKPNSLQPGDVVSFTRARPVNFGLSPTAATTTSTFRPATISAIGIVKPGGSIIAKVVSPTLQVLTPTPQPGSSSTQVPWRTLLAAREATALTYLKPPPISQQHTWFLSQSRPPRFVRRIYRRRSL